MKHPFPYPPISAQAVDALGQVERATSLKGLESAFDTVRSEAFRHYKPSVLIWVLAALPIGAGAAAAQVLGWVGPTDNWIYALALVAAWAMLPASEYLLRGPRRWKDEQRVRDALNLWRVLERAEKSA